MTARTSDSRRIRYCSPSRVTSVPLYFPYRTLSPTLTSIGTRLSFSKRPGPTDDLALLGLFLRRVGDVETAAHLLRFLESLDDDAIGQRIDLHRGGTLGGHRSPPSSSMGCTKCSIERC